MQKIAFTGIGAARRGNRPVGMYRSHIHIYRQSRVSRAHTFITFARESRSLPRQKRKRLSSGRFSLTLSLSLSLSFRFSTGLKIETSLFLRSLFRGVSPVRGSLRLLLRAHNEGEPSASPIFFTLIPLGRSLFHAETSAFAEENERLDLDILMDSRKVGSPSFTDY